MRWFPLASVMPVRRAVLLAAIALSEFTFALGGLVGLADGIVAAERPRHLLEDVLAVVVFSLAIGAGVLLWRGRAAGLALSLGVQSFQLFGLIVDQMAIRFVAGPQFTWYGRFPRIWSPYGWEGSFVAVARPEFPSFWVGVNLVALIVVVYLASALRSERQRRPAAAAGRCMRTALPTR